MKKVIVIRDDINGEIEVYEAKNPDRLLGFFSSEEELKCEMEKKNWQVV